MTGPFGTTPGPWIDQGGEDREFTGMYDTWLGGGPDGDTIVCACWDDDKRAIAQVPAMLELVQAMNEGGFEPVKWVEMARAIARRLEEK